MKYLELLEQIELVEAAKDKYLPMLNFMDQIPPELQNAIKPAKEQALKIAEQAIQTLGNSDRIVWAMRQNRLNAMSSMIYILKRLDSKLSAAAGEIGNDPSRMYNQPDSDTEISPEELEAGKSVLAKWRHKRHLALETIRMLERLFQKDSQKMHTNAQKEIRAEIEVANQRAYKAQSDLQDIENRAHANPGQNFAQSEAEAAAELQRARRMVSVLAQEVDKPFELRSFNWQVLANVSHYLAIPYQPIQDYRFGWKSQNVVGGVLDELESIWVEKKKRTVSHDIEDYENIEKIMEFDGGKVAWFNLHKEYCSIEGAAMGHCGNEYENMQPGDEVLSLREHKEEDIWKPHLTFIYNTEDGNLSEMKGYKNNKPSSEYHKYIVPLLEQDWVAGIKLRVHQHEKENNFFISDLPEDEARRLYELKPALATYRDVKELGLRTQPGKAVSLEEINTLLSEIRVQEIAGEDEDNFILNVKENWVEALQDITGDGLMDPDDIGVPDHEDLESIYDQFSKHTKQIHIDYVKAAYPNEVRQFIEDEFIDEEDFGFDHALEIMRGNNDIDEGLNIIVEEWQKYHAEAINERLEYMMANPKRWFDETGQENDPEFDVEYEFGRYPFEGNEDAYAITIDKDVFFNEIWPKIEESDNLDSSWFGLLGLSHYYFDSANDMSDMYFEGMDQDNKDWMNGQVSMRSDDKVYHAMREHMKGIVQ